MLTEEQREIRTLAREFAEGEIRPGAPAWDEARVLDPAVFASLAELGFFGMRIPERDSGLGLDLATFCVALEQLAWGDAAVALSVSIHNGPVAELLQRHGTEAQRARILPAMASGRRWRRSRFRSPMPGATPVRSPPPLKRAPTAGT